MADDYSEDRLVEESAVAELAALGWETVAAWSESFREGGEGGTLGREARSDVVLVPRLRAALARLNPALPPEALDAAVDELTRDRSAMSLEAANREIYRLMKDGIEVSVPDREHGGQTTERPRVIDWQEPANNDFLMVRQMSVTGPLHTRRPDLVGFVNGLPWLVVELKKTSVALREAFDKNISDYKETIPALFRYNALIVVSTGTRGRVGSVTADWDRFFAWKRVESESEPRDSSLETLLRGTCEPSRLLDLVENFTLFSEHKEGLVKVLGQNHQVLGVNNAIESMRAARGQGHGQGGVFWHTQGSGKSFSMVFFAQKVLRKLAGNWSFVVVTDRVELDDQIAKTFKAAGAVSESESRECHAGSGEHLRKLLLGNHRYVFTLIHKFQTAETLCDRPDVIVLTDEAHRSQYDTLALNMRAALPGAIFLAFTGTPLIAGEERTKEVFGDYTSVYSFQESILDGATVPLFYENRTPELELVNPDLNEDIYRVIEEAELGAEEEEKLERELGRQYHILTRDDRLETVAEDIVQHFLGRGFQGKAMVVSIDKATALRMHDKVRKHWDAETGRVRSELERGDLPNERRAELMARLDLLTGTDMAVVVSPQQDEIQTMRKLGLDIEPHRRRMNESQPALDEKFKDGNDPLRLVFVCAMWLTGFDVPSCSTVYLDKPMRNHTLMQTIARANRVFPGKHSGLIVDYAGVLASLEHALSIYGAGESGERPIQDKRKLVEALREAVARTTEFCARHGVRLEEIEAGGPNRLRKLGDAVERLTSPEPVRREFLSLERDVDRLHRAVKPDVAALEFAARTASLGALAGAIRENLDRPDLSRVLGRIEALLDESILGITIRDSGAPPLDLSAVNLEDLAARFLESARQNVILEMLTAAIRDRLERMIETNPSRADYAAKLEEMIERYNAGSRGREEHFRDIVRFARLLDEEQKRHLRENLNEEELAVFDILTRPGPELSAKERNEVKKVVQELLPRMKELLVLNWRQKQTARARIQEAIRSKLDELPESYTSEVYDQKCSAVFRHIYEKYPERDVGIYASAG